MVALVRATVWTVERPDGSPQLAIRSWELGGPQVEQLRDFLTTVVEPNAERGSMVLVEPQTDDAGDSIVLSSICAYLMPHHRVLHIGQYVALQIESDQQKYILRYPGDDKPPPGGSQLVARSELGSLWRLTG
jgi:hypothetical protein